jgi:D-hydroxyproline dehydrogenase subunit alpha
MSRCDTEILIVGGGAAGLSAAVAASAKASVTIVDDNPYLGGQIWRAELGKTKSIDARKLIDRISAGNIRIQNNAQVFSSENRSCLLAETQEGRLELTFEKLIIATGARERFLPFPGWTLPGVFGAGGLQAMVKGGMSVASKRIVVAGTGPLLLAVAEFLKQRGAKVVAIIEQASVGSIRRFATGLWRYPAKLSQAAALRMRLGSISYMAGSWVTSVSGDGKLESITINRGGKPLTVNCDFLACGFHLVPNTELAALLNCRILNGFVKVNDLQQTSVEDIYCAGEPTGIGGVEASLIEGTIAGLAASGQTDEALSKSKRRNKTRGFENAMNTAFSLRNELKSVATADTIVCRCEDVRYGSLPDFRSFRDAKLQTRCGMGPCQGRICGPATEFLFDWEPPSVRPPIFPVKMENL